MKRILRIIGILILLGLLVGGYLGWDIYKNAFTPNMPTQLTNEYIYIPTNSTYEEVEELLYEQGFILDRKSFKWTANKMSYIKNPMRAGRYKVKGGMTNRALVTKLRGGAQAPVKVAINNKRKIEDVAGYIATLLEPDSMDFLMALTNEQLLSEYGLTKATAITAIIPNTYELYWNTSADGFFDRMISEHQRFWTKERRAKASKLSLSPEEVYTLASIVEKESQQASERPRIAGVYLNRLRKGMRLEADPTVVFAVGDFELRRVLNKHLAYDSPYNTYKYSGLPPGPIYMASINSIDAVLNAEKHDYIFFCAKPGYEGYHAFAKTLAGHNVNAQKYRAWLNKQGIR